MVGGVHKAATGFTVLQSSPQNLKGKTLVRIFYSNCIIALQEMTVTCKVHNITATAKYLVEQTELY